MFKRILTTLATTVFVTGAYAETVTINVWARADKNTNVGVESFIEGARILNEQYQSQGKDITVEVNIQRSKAKGYDDDMLKVMRVMSVNKGPDIFLMPHEWIGTFADAGYVAPWGEIVANSEQLQDIIPGLWNSVTYREEKYGIPVIPEARMFYYNKDYLRQIGKSEEFINGIPDKVRSGEFTIYDFTELAKEVVDAGLVKYGIIQRPNAGPDFYMLLAGFGQESFQDSTGRMMLDQAALLRTLEWIKSANDSGVLSSTNFTMSWSAIHSAFIDGEAFVKFHGIWGVPAMLESGNFGDDEASYFNKIGWTDMPSFEVGGKSANLTHPLAWAVSSKSPHQEIATDLVAAAVSPEIYTKWAEQRSFMAIYNQQLDFESYKAAWVPANGVKLLENAISMPIHPDVGVFTSIIFKSIEGVGTGRISPEDGVKFVVEEVKAELGDKVVVN